jgi:hypothetical protein
MDLLISTMSEDVKGILSLDTPTFRSARSQGTGGLVGPLVEDSSATYCNNNHRWLPDQGKHGKVTE